MNPNQAVDLVTTGFQVAGAVSKFMEQREKRKTAEARRAAAASPAQLVAPLTPDELEARSNAFRHDILVVMGVLGEKLLTLGAVNDQWLPFAREEVLRCLRIKGEPFRAIFEEDMEDAMQYAVTAGMFLCAGCWPLPIYRGFGACVLNEWLWASPDPAYPRDNDPETTKFDDCVALLKTVPQGRDVLTRYPLGLNQMTATCNKDEKYPELAFYLEHRNKEVKKRGMPQPWDGSFFFTDIIWPWSTYDSNFALQNRFSYSFSEISNMLRWQQDAGRMIYAFTIGGFLDLQPGQMIEPTSDIASSILWWLFGFSGTTFKLIRQCDLNITHWKMKAKYQRQWDLGLMNIYAVRDEYLVQQQNAARLAMMSSMFMAPPGLPSPTTPTDTLQTAPAPLSPPPTASYAYPPDWKPNPPFSPVSPPPPEPSSTTSTQPTAAPFTYTRPQASSSPEPGFPSQSEVPGQAASGQSSAGSAQPSQAMPAKPVVAMPSAEPNPSGIPVYQTNTVSPLSTVPPSEPAPFGYAMPPPNPYPQNMTSPWPNEQALVPQNYQPATGLGSMPIAPPSHDPEPRSQPVQRIPRVPVPVCQAPKVMFGVSSPLPAVYLPPSASQPMIGGMVPQHMPHPTSGPDVVDLSGAFHNLSIRPIATQTPQQAPPSQFGGLTGQFASPSIQTQTSPCYGPNTVAAIPPPSAPVPQPTSQTVAAAPVEFLWENKSYTTGPPPAYALRKVEAQFDFTARSEREISFHKGDVLEILQDNGDGWLLARTGGFEGRIPEAYVTAF